MSDILSRIVTDNQAITAVLDGPEGFRLERLIDLYRTSDDKDAFVAAVIVKLMLEHDRRALIAHAIERTL